MAQPTGQGCGSERACRNVALEGGQHIGVVALEYVEIPFDVVVVAHGVCRSRRRSASRTWVIVS